MGYMKPHNHTSCHSLVIYKPLWLHSSGLKPPHRFACFCLPQLWCSKMADARYPTSSCDLGCLPLMMHWLKASLVSSCVLCQYIWHSDWLGGYSLSWPLLWPQPHTFIDLVLFLSFRTKAASAWYCIECIMTSFYLTHEPVLGQENSLFLVITHHFYNQLDCFGAHQAFLYCTRGLVCHLNHY